MYTRFLNLDVKYLFKYTGLALILIPTLVFLFNENYFLFGYNIHIAIKTLFSILILIGTFYIALVDTSFFRVKPLNTLINRDINEYVFGELDAQLEIELAQSNKTILHKKTQHKFNNSKFKLKPIKQIVDIIDNLEVNLFPHNSKIDIVKIFVKNIPTSKVPLNIKSDKNIVKVLPIFEFFDEIVEGGILNLCDKSKAKLFNFILDNFSKNGEAFVYRNLQNRYNVWKSKKGVNAFTIHL